MRRLGDRAERVGGVVTAVVVAAAAAHVHSDGQRRRGWRRRRKRGRRSDAAVDCVADGHDQLIDGYGAVTVGIERQTVVGRPIAEGDVDADDQLVDGDRAVSIAVARAGPADERHRHGAVRAIDAGDRRPIRRRRERERVVQSIRAGQRRCGDAEGARIQRAAGDRGAILTGLHQHTHGGVGRIAAQDAGVDRFADAGVDAARRRVDQEGLRAERDVVRRGRDGRAGELE